MLTATRNFYLARELAVQGNTVHIICKPNESAKKFLLPNQYMHEVTALDYRKILTWLGAKDGVTNNLIKRPQFVNKAHQLLLDYPLNKWIAEGGGFYLKKAIAKGKEILSSSKIDFIYSSYRPMSDHFIAQALKKDQPSIRWIGDFRDILWWSKEDTHYQKKWIQELIQDMDFRTAVTQGISTFWKQVTTKDFNTLYNGLPFLAAKSIRQQTTTFEINYTGRIYTEFQRADILFKVLHELIAENKEFGRDLLIRYTGFQYLTWKSWIENYKLERYSHTSFQVNQNTAIQHQNNAGINVLLTWCNDEIQGFIHGKYNEYVLARKPIVCIVEGTLDIELKSKYDRLKNSIIVCNSSEYHSLLKTYIVNHYSNWKNGKEELISEATLEDYNWNYVARPLLHYIDTH